MLPVRRHTFIHLITVLLHSFRLIFTSLLFSLMAMPTVFGQALQTSQVTEETSIRDHLRVLPDSSRLSLSALSRAEVQAQFKPLEQYERDVLYAPDQTHYWIQFTLENDGSEQESFFLELANIDFATLYTPQNSPVEPFRKQETGMLVPPAERPFFFGRVPHVRLDIPGHTKRTYYLQVYFTSNYNLQNRAEFFRPLESLSVIPVAEQEEYNRKARYYQGFFLGAMILISLYNLFVFFFVRDDSYLFYTLFIGLLALFHMTHEGYALELLWPEYPAWDLVSMYNIRASAWIAFTWFAGRFLNLREIAPIWRRVMQGIAGLYVLFILFTFLNYWNLYLFHVLTLINILVVLGLNIWFVVRRYRPALFFLIANSFYILGTLIIQVALLFNLDFESDILWHAEEIGDVLQALFFSAALADRINLMREKIQEQEKEQVRIAERQKEELEKQVDARTQELIIANENIHTLSNIGQKITAALHKSDVVDTVYKHLSQTMDTSVFGIALLNEDKKQLEFKEFILNGEKQPPVFIDTDEKDRLSLICMRERKTIFINDYDKEYSKYLSQQLGGKFIADRKSLIYLPLIQDEEVIGVMTVQSPDPNAYTEQDKNILQTLATYIIIALDNAQAYNEIEEARQDIERTNQQITDSLRYAQDIQEVILPEPEEMESYFRDQFITYIPKDFVSGDYYWVKKVGKRTYFAVADCTGHGVPGAFMSMIGTTLLNQVIEQTKDCDEILVDILANLHVGVRKALKQEITGNDDGMDVVLCYLEPDETTGGTRVAFAGAKRPLYYTQNGTLHEIRGTNKTIGGRIKRRRKKSRKFEQHDLLLQPDDMIYFTTDGFVDQASPDHNKFGSVKFRELLEEICTFPPAQQKQRLETSLQAHQRHEEQRDDITVIGVQV